MVPLTVARPPSSIGDVTVRSLKAAGVLLLMCSPGSTLLSESPAPWKNQSRTAVVGAAVTVSAAPSSLTVVPKLSLNVPFRPPPLPVSMSWNRVS